MQEIKSRKNPLIVHLKKLGADGEYRRTRGEFLCDGAKLLREAIDSGADIKVVLTSDDTLEALPETVAVYSVGQDIIGAVSPLKNAQSVLFSCAIPAARGLAWPANRETDAPPDSPAPFSHIIVLEGVQDPGNVGTVIRSADALGISAVVLTGGCADPYNPKTVRATMGAIFRQCIIITDINGVAALKLNGYRLIGAALGESSRDIREVPLQNAAVVIGSEGNGLSEDLLALCDERLVIPMAPQSESLNAAVAAAIVMWEARRALL